MLAAHAIRRDDKGSGHDKGSSVYVVRETRKADVRTSKYSHLSSDHPQVELRVDIPLGMSVYCFVDVRLRELKGLF